MRAFPRYLALALALLVAACAGTRHTPHSAGVEAARIANDRCQERYGARPFHPEDHIAEMIAGRWIWGGEGTVHVDGFSVEISFTPDGGDVRIRVDRDEQFGNPDAL